MAPARALKRQKTNEGRPIPAEGPPPAEIPLPETPGPQEPASTNSADTPAGGNQRSVRTYGITVHKLTQNQSWYSRTWPRKAPPITQVAHESIASANNVATEAVNTVKERASPKPKSVRSPSLAMTLGKAKSNRSLPIDAATTKIHATSEPTTLSRTESASKDVSSDTVKRGTSNPAAEETPQVVVDDAGKDNPKDSEDAPQPATETKQEDTKTSTGSWLGWLARGDGVQPEQIPPPREGAESQPENTQVSSPGIANPAVQQDDGQKKEGPPQQTVANNKRSWLQMWSGDTSSKPGSSAPTTDVSAPEQETMPAKNLDLSRQDPPSENGPRSVTSSLEESEPPALPNESTKSAAWVFWSRERKVNSSSASIDQPHVGEIAISDTTSEALPRRTSISLKDNNKNSKLAPKTAQQKVVESTTAIPEPESTKDQGSANAHKKQGSKDKDGMTKTETKDAAASSREPCTADVSGSASLAPSKNSVPNLLLPRFEDTLGVEEGPTMLQQLARLLYYTKEPESRHLSLVRDPPRIQNCLAIGVHGYFPAPLIRSVLGHPTGTSLKFADMAAKAIKRWAKQRGYECQVKSAALEGEGKISERIELLWKLLLNWIDEIRKSDFVLVACHSQGVPVATMLVAKLIQFGCLNSARVGICAMAGVSMGPFPEFRSRWISGSAGELFEFSDPNSRVSTDYLAALDAVLKFGVRLSYIGSIDDQLVPLESSVFSPITHPHIYRAVLIDSRLHTPDFISHLVGFVLKLRNVGVKDHGLIRELSSPLAGSLYTGDGHSRIYENDSIYDLAVSFALETTAILDVPITTSRQTAGGSGNPYILPFAMRGILEEDFVKTELQSEASELLEQFDDWKPSTKQLKDVKFRLEGIRSRL